MGQLAHEALQYLTDRRDLGIHSDVVSDAIIPLLEHGSLTGAKKTRHPFKIVASMAVGSRQLYDLIDGNPLFSWLNGLRCGSGVFMLSTIRVEFHLAGCGV